jgi:hypothetical protein
MQEMWVVNMSRIISANKVKDLLASKILTSGWEYDNRIGSYGELRKSINRGGERAFVGISIFYNRSYGWSVIVRKGFYWLTGFQDYDIAIERMLSSFESAYKRAQFWMKLVEKKKKVLD